MFVKASVKLLAAAVVAGLPFVTRAQSTTTTSTTTIPATAESVLDARSNELVAKGQGLVITRGQLEEEFVRLKAQLAGQGKPIPAEHRSMIEANLLQQLIGLRLISSHATAADRAAAKELAAKRYEEAKTRIGNDEMFELRLKAENLTKDELMKKWEEQGGAEKVLERELSVEVTEEEARKFYDDNPGQFEQPEMVRASHILISTRDEQKRELSAEQKTVKRTTAEGVLKRARSGEDFAQLAKEYSDDPGSKDKGGEYTFPRGRMVPEFEAAAFTMQPGQISDIVTTTFGYHIIKLIEKIPAKKVEFKTVESDLKNVLKTKEIQKKLPDYLAKLKKEAEVEILDESLKMKDAPPVPAGHSATGGLPAGHPPVSTPK